MIVNVVTSIVYAKSGKNYGQMKAFQLCYQLVLQWPSISRVFCMGARSVLLLE